ncbi:MAG: hypothetical protein ABUL62_02950 [Myxococcales bacterium]
MTGNQIVQYPESGAKPQVVDFCSNGSSMTLSGADGAHLNASPGRRSMLLSRGPDSGCPEDDAGAM